MLSIAAVLRQIRKPPHFQYKPLGGFILEVISKIDFGSSRRREETDVLENWMPSALLTSAATNFETGSSNDRVMCHVELHSNRSLTRAQLQNLLNDGREIRQ